MPFICGIDYSSQAVDIVLLDEDSNTARHYVRRLDIGKPDTMTRLRRIPDQMPARSKWMDDVTLVAIEKPFTRGKGRGSDTMQIALGAIIACVPARMPLMLLRADDWRSVCKLPIRCDRDQHKRNAKEFAAGLWRGHPDPLNDNQADAFCIAHAARELHEKAQAA